MRAFEFLKEAEPAAGAATGNIDQLQNQIKTQVDKVADIGLLNKIASMLRGTNIGNIAKYAFKKDSDATKFVNRLAEMIIQLDVPISEKANFLRDFGRKNYISASDLFDKSGDVKTMDSWWQGTGLATTMFKMMINDPLLQGKSAGEAGPGEVAIACFHRDISVGTDPKAGYDLKYGSDEIEVKAAVAETGSSGGGRWTAANDYPLDTYARGGQSLLDPEKLPKSVALLSGGRSIPGIADVLNNPEYLKTEEGQAPTTFLNAKQQADIYEQVLKLAYPNASKDSLAAAVAEYPKVTRSTVSKVAFENYKAKQQFSSMLLLKVAGGTVQTCHFTDLSLVLDKMTIGTIYFSGQQRGASVQASFK